MDYTGSFMFLTRLYICFLWKPCILGLAPDAMATGHDRPHTPLGAAGVDSTAAVEKPVAR
jgi:hypothetical protein